MARLFVFVLLISAVTTFAAIEYTNHTVGGSKGWFFDEQANISSADYQKWAANETFNLGDYLIFNTDTNQTVMSTTNATTFKLCDYGDDSEVDVYSGGTTDFGVKTVVIAQLRKERENFFFSHSMDGVQCLHGMKFKIFVNYGNGLPPQPPSPVPSPPIKQNLSDSPPAITQDHMFHGRGCRRVLDISVMSILALVSMNFHGPVFF